MNGLVKKLRLFVAIKISETFQKEILAWRELLLDQPGFADPSMSAARPVTTGSTIPSRLGGRENQEILLEAPAISPVRSRGRSPRPTSNGIRHGCNGVRWLDGKNLHITLIPPWYESDIKYQISKIKNMNGEPFEILFNQVTYGPDPRRPRLIWAEGKTPEELLKLKARLEDVLRMKPEPRLFSLHLTLARFRPEDFSGFKMKELNEKVTWRDEVRSVALMESRLSPQGADYEVLEEIHF